jgi:hypothetical protein
MWLRCLGPGIAALLVLWCSSSAALAAKTHAFDAKLSLTGDCSVSTLDPVPDPGPCPGVTGVDHPGTPINNPKAVATDFWGNMYVSSAGPETALGTEGKIVIFDSAGNFITEIADESGPGALAIDSEGYLYVANAFNALEEGLVRYEPTGIYEPANGKIEYGDPPVVLAKTEASGNGLAINPLNDHLFRKESFKILEYKSAAESVSEANEEVGSFGEGALQQESVGIAVDAAHGRVYAAAWQGTPGNITKVVRAFDLAAPHNLLFTIEESEMPEGKITSSFLSLAADEGTGHLFVYDGAGKKVHEFETSNTGAKYLTTIEHGFQYVFLSEIGVDNGANSPNGALSAERYLFVPSRTSTGGAEHSFAFGPSTECPAVIESSSFSNVGETEAELEASIEPCGLETHYVFEYLTKQQWEESGETFTGAGAPVAGEGNIPAGNSPIKVAAAAEGLAPGTTYRFRVEAKNSEEPAAEEEGEFATYAAAEAFSPCPNDTLRSSFSALLPDCRAYELVTPPDTNARTPHGVSHLGTYFATRESSPSGGALSFQIEGGIIPGSEATGAFAGDPYLSTRSEDGWGTALAGPDGSEAGAPTPGSTSPDQGYSFWSTAGSPGSAAIEGKTSNYVRYPDGHSALVGRGSIANDLQATGRLISEGGTHIIFVSGGNGFSAIKLEPNAPPSGTQTIYDRTPDEVTHVVSLLPEGKTPKAGEHATYEGASLDGKGVAFKIGTTLYLRVNEETFELGEGVTFAGIAEGGTRVFYLEGGKLWRFDAASEEKLAFNASGTVTPVNVSADGTTAYFVSTKVLTSELNPNKVKAVNGNENLYRSREGQISFVGAVTKRDVEGASNGNQVVDGLGLWTSALSEGKLGADPSRTTPDGNALLFESRAPLDGYDPEGNAEVYRYDAAANELDCLSCTPTLAPATSDASLESISAGQGDPEPFSFFGYIANLRADGKRAFFQSEEALVPGDVDGLQDAYEWEAQGVGSCNQPGGCVYLVSSGHSLRTDYLYAASDSGDDVFFRTGDILLPRDAEETPSIYDARVNGGFAEPLAEECVGEGCRPGLSPAPALEPPAQPALGANDNVSSKRCPKTKRKVRRHGKVVCVKKKKHQKHHHKNKAGKSKGAGK